MREKFKKLLPLGSILILALILRWYGVNWDEGWHLHPDERMLIMVADRVQLFSQMNPDFFNYGSLPIYILKGVAQTLAYFFTSPVANYDGLLSIGRGISIALELGTIMLIYKTAWILFDHKKPAEYASILYALAFFPIQNSHFFIVDNFLNFFMAAIAYLMISYLRKPHIIKVLLLGIMTAAAVTTKATGLVLLAPVGISLVLPYQKQTKIMYLLTMFLRVFMYGLFFGVSTYLFMPYAFSTNIIWSNIVSAPLSILNPKLLDDVSLQMKMNSDPFIFPYTLQYVNTAPYLYYIKNIVIWGLGPFISFISLLGFGLFLLTVKKALQKHQIGKHTFRKLFLLPIANKQLRIMVYLCFYLFFFLVLGRSAVKFMRYMLPLYAPLVVLGGFCLYEFLTYYHKVEKKPTAFQIRIKPYVNGFGLILLIGAVVWTLMFERIYSKIHTRIAASTWIYQHIPPSASIAVEHWDDRLPLPLHDTPYTFNELTLYDPDSTEKWLRVNEALKQSDYMIIASNRLYIPLTKLTDCKKLPIFRCYPQTSEYYKKLFAGKLDFTKVAEFSSYPTLQLGKWKIEIPDDSADESFTVYDHPKILIFKKK